MPHGPLSGLALTALRPRPFDRLFNTLRGQTCSALFSGGIEPTRYYPASKWQGGVRPVILCEFAHAMGNSTGNMHEWWDLFERLPYCQGGFIWDWVDQGLSQRLPMGGEGTRFAYGGDWGERQHDARFCINGLIGPDRRPHPGLLEVKHALQPLLVKLTSFAYKSDGKTAAVQLQVTDLRSFSRLSRVSPLILLEVDGSSVLSTRSQDAPLVVWKHAPTGRSAELLVTLSLRGATAGPPLANPFLKSEAFLTITLVDADTPSYLPKEASHVARVQFSVSLPPPPLSSPPWAAGGASTPLRCDELDDRFVISGGGGRAVGSNGLVEDRFQLTVSKVDGTIGPLLVAGRVVFEAGGAALHLWRAPTENDRGSSSTSVANPKEDTIRGLVWWYNIIINIVLLLPPLIFPPGYSHSDLWARDGLDDLRRCLSEGTSVALTRHSANRVELTLTCEIRGPRGELRAEHQQVLTVLPNGAIAIENTADVRMAESDSLGRIGLRFRVPKSAAGVVDWYGRGPHENYCDRKRSANVSQHSARSEGLGEELTRGYVYPQSCGQRADVRWLALRASSCMSAAAGSAVAAPERRQLLPEGG